MEGSKSSGGLLPSTKGAVSEQGPNSFEDSLNSLQKMAAAMVQNLKGSSEDEMEEINISFGLKASTEVNGLIISRGGMDNNFSVSVRWRNASKTEQSEKKDESE